MSFGSGFGSGGGFGANKNTNTGFGFGANSTGSGFGQQNNAPAFGANANNTGGTGFGSTPSIFGSGSGGFGSTPSFGGTTANNSSTGGGLFGNTANNNASNGFGGFGANNNNTPNSSTGGLFGNTNRTGFGNSNGTGLFGNSGNTAAPNTFGSTTNNTNNLFSTPQGTALGQPVPESQGTATPPFQPFTEKDTPSGTATNHFQTITFMQPYQKYSLEELRIADYNQGRRFATSTGQAGGFGSTSFGGFGNNNTSTTGTGLFGQQSQAPTFGTNTSTTTNTFGGGANNTGGGFGLFGNTNNQQAGGAFGTANNTTGFGNQQQNSAFGGGASGGASGGLFGNTQTSKPPSLTFSSTTSNNASGGLFGNPNQGASTGFGTQNNSGGGGLFGNLANQNNAFGSANSSAPNSTSFGTPTANNTTGGLFGNLNQNNQQTTGGGLFGNSNAASGGSMFGNKPATNTGSNAFGSTNTTGGGGLFGNLPNNNNTTQNPQNQGGGLFGTNNNTGNTGGGLFGNLSNNSAAQTNSSNQSTGLFGSLGQTQSQNQNQSGGLFGNQSTNNSSNPMNSSLLNSSQQTNALQPPQAYIASMLDRSPYGSASIFNGLPPPPQTSPGPIATPISIGSAQRRPTPLPQQKLNSGIGSRYMTPQKRGYGFSYSTYGTPSSISSIASTPGAYGNSLFGSSFGRNLGKSYSMGNLRRTYDGETESILSPGAFSSTNTRRSGGGGLKRLTIDRSLRTDLFGNQALAALPTTQAPAQPNQTPSLKKKVSFGSTTLNSNGPGPASGDNEQNSTTSGNSLESSKRAKAPLDAPAPSSAPPDPQPDAPTTRGSARPNTTRTNGLVNGTQGSNVRGNELAIVHEDESGTPTGPSRSSPRPTAPGDGRDPIPGSYYMIPSSDELKKYTRAQLKQVSGLILGRENCGFVQFDKPIDMTTLDIDYIFPNLAQMDIRSLTIYPDTPNKPAPGQSLNMPATIHLPNSWPRLRDKITPSLELSGPRFDKHVSRLKSIGGTEFVRYEKETGTWVFKVPHFSRYGLDYDSDEDDLGESQLSAFPDSPTPKTRTPKGRDTPIPPSGLLQSSTLSERLAYESSGYDSSLEDTFEYRKQKLFPGAFEPSRLVHDDKIQTEEVPDDETAFLEQRSAVAPPHHTDGREPSNVDGDGEVEDDFDPSYEEEDSMDVVGAFPQQDPEDVFLDRSVFGPRSILNGAQQDTPDKPFDIAAGWVQQLQRTVSPQKRDRLVLRESTANRPDVVGVLPQGSPTKPQPKSDRKAITTSIDLMKSLFGQEEVRRSGQGKRERQSEQRQGLQWPYPEAAEAQKPRQTSNEQYQNLRKPLSFGSAGRLVCEKANAPLKPSNRSTAHLITRFVKEKGIQLVPIQKQSTGLITPNLVHQRSCTTVYLEGKFPYAKGNAIPFQDMEKGAPAGAVQEGLIWRLASILFNDYDDDFSRGVPAFQKTKFKDHIRKDRLSKFWHGLCQDEATKAVAIASSAELRALAHLSMHNVEDACKVLLEGKNFRLATLVAQIGTDTVVQGDIRAQITEWGSLKVLSEMTEPVRALYELLAGNAFMCTGQDGHVEDRALPFSISEKFGLDWKRAFGLRLWYAKTSDDTIEAAIEQFEEDLKAGETGVPIISSPNYGGLSCQPKGQILEQEDVLWQMMKLSVNFEYLPMEASMQAILSTTSQVDSRLAFQLLQGLSYSELYTHLVDADRVVTDFAVDLDNAGEWVWAAWVLLHLSSRELRFDALKKLIYARASQIGEVDSETFHTLHNEFHIPKAMLYGAKALYARAVEGDYVQELLYLLKAKEFDEAHTRLVQVVGPQAVITQDHTILQDVLDSFPDKDWVKDWSLGGQVYEDYIRLTKGLSKQERGSVIKRLMSALAIMEKRRGDRMGFEEGVALQEMCNVVGQAVLKEQDKASFGSRVLLLPSTENSYINHTRELSLQYYEAIMAGGR